MKPTPAIRPHLITLALLAACSAASAQVTVDNDPLKTYSWQSNGVIATPNPPNNVLNYNEYAWSGSSVTATSDPASVMLGTPSRTSTADSTASGSLSGTTFTTESWASAVSDNRYERQANQVWARSGASIDNAITFTVGQLSNYSWYSSFLSVVSGTADSSTDPYFWLLDAASNPISGCQTCADGTSLGSGQLVAGTYVLSWGGSVGSYSYTPGSSPTLGTQNGSAVFTQFGELTVTPVPEPEGYALALAGFALVGSVMARRRRKSA
jgi:hypothetical protein